MNKLIDKYQISADSFYYKFLKDSLCGTFLLDDNGKPNYKEWQTSLIHRDQVGWNDIWQKVFITDEQDMTLGITVVEPGGGGRDGLVAVEFCDYVICGKGELEVGGLGMFEIEAGDFIHFEKGITRSFKNTGDELFIAVFCLKATPSFDFESKKGVENVGSNVK